MPRRVTLAFMAVIAVAFLVLVLLAWQIRVTRNLSAENRRSVEVLCNTTATLDAALVVPFLIETKLAINVLPVADRTSLMRLRANLEIAHEELAATANCEEVR